MRSGRGTRRDWCCWGPRSRRSGTTRSASPTAMPGSGTERSGWRVATSDLTVTGNLANHEPLRPRKLLLHRREINRLTGAVAHKGFTLVPLSLYFEKGRAKVELGVARGKTSLRQAGGGPPPRRRPGHCTGVEASMSMEFGVVESSLASPGLRCRGADSPSGGGVRPVVPVGG